VHDRGSANAYDRPIVSDRHSCRWLLAPLLFALVLTLIGGVATPVSAQQAEGAAVTGSLDYDDE
jgi:hypothetical protein